MIDILRDLLLSIALWGGVALCFVAASNFNEFAYDKIKGWFND